MFWLGSLISQVLQWTQFWALICSLIPSPVSSGTYSYTPGRGDEWEEVKQVRASLGLCFLPDENKQQIFLKYRITCYRTAHLIRNTVWILISVVTLWIIWIWSGLVWVTNTLSLQKTGSTEMEVVDLLRAFPFYSKHNQTLIAKLDNEQLSVGLFWTDTVP